MSKTYTLTLTDAQDKALSTVAIDNQEWIENAIFDRCRIAIEEIVAAEVQRKLAAGETISGTKDEIVLAADVETAVERNERFNSEVLSRQNA
jgi:hypothetical protein